MRLQHNYRILFSLVLVSFVSNSFAQIKTPAAIAGDFADPSIIQANGKYYAVGTSSEWAPHFPIYTSTNLNRWIREGYVFDVAPDWTNGSFWAPEYYYHNNKYYLYYTARRKKDNISCIGVAVSSDPGKGFVDQGIVVDFGKEAIDPFIFNDNGQLYITFKAYGLDKRPIELLASKLSSDGLKMEGEVFSLLRDDNRNGMEGQSILKHNDYYYLFYSAGGCCGPKCSYNLRVARSKNFKGPYQDYSMNPILSESDEWKCQGHGTFTPSRGDEYTFLYHAYSKSNTVFTGREGRLADLKWNKETGWPYLIARNQPKTSSSNISTKFKEEGIENYWQWDFRNSTPTISQYPGELHLTGTVKESNLTGIVITVRPTNLAFDFSTTVLNNNDALKGLAFYGDAGASIGIGVRNDKIEYWMVKDNKRTILAESLLTSEAPVQLKFSMKKDLSCEVFFKQANMEWQQVGKDIKPSLSFLPQWDRSPRAGLHYQGPQEEKAVFGGFECVNR